jgi:hypothetical protein
MLIAEREACETTSENRFSAPLLCPYCPSNTLISCCRAYRMQQALCCHRLDGGFCYPTIAVGGIHQKAELGAGQSFSRDVVQ